MINILSLYWDLTELYGSRANLLSIERDLKESGVEYCVDKKTLGDELDFNRYDLIIMGCASEKSLMKIREDIMRYKHELLLFVEGGGFILALGNTMLLLLESIEFNGETYPCLAIEKGKASLSDKKRYTSNAIYRRADTYTDVVGYINKSHEVEDIEHPLFYVRYGIGDNKKSKEAGFYFRNVYGVDIVDPVLVKNPLFRREILSKLLEVKGIDATLVEDELWEEEMLAYKGALDELLELKKK